ncbi:MAG TPA: hypothetical protein DF383_06160 [Deltaproteobacteria bacterium]|nr:hypothetical protein [Deltaproteobacteria bacterium]
MKSPYFHSLARPSLWVGILSSAVAVLAAVLWPSAFFQSYLVVYLFWLGLTLGCLVWTLLYPLTGGDWLAGLQKYFSAGRDTLALMIPLFLPLGFGVSFLYPWADAARVAADPRLQEKSAYLNLPFFSLRQVLFFLGWSLIAVGMKRAKSAHLSRWGAGGLLFYGASMLLASTDWMMSLSPHWSSTIFAFIVMVTQALSAAAFVIFFQLSVTGKHPPAIPSADKLGDLGNILFTLILLWSYLVFMQFLIIWAGNLPEEVVWYLPRVRGFWGGLIVLLAALQFAIPFFLLLFRSVKHRAARLKAIAGGLFAFHFLFMNWLLLPSLPRVSAHDAWIEAILFAAIGGLWLSVFSRNRRREPPGLAEAAAPPLTSEPMEVS